MNSRLRSLFIVHISMLVLSLGSSIIYTGIWPYLQRLDSRVTLTVYGFVVASDAFGQMLFSPVFGWMSDKLQAIRPAALICAGTFIAGNAFYSLVTLVPKDWLDAPQPRVWTLLIARFVVGIGTAINAAARAYVSKVTTLEERTTHIALLSLFQTIGFVIGPGIQAALTPIGDGPIDEESVVVVNMYTATGWVSTFNGIVLFILFMPGIFVEHQGSGPQEPQQQISAQPKTEESMVEGRTRRKSHVVSAVPREVLALRRKDKSEKPRELLKQYSAISVFDGKNYAVDKKVDDEKKKRLQEEPAAPRPDFFAVSVATWCFFSFFCSFVLMETLVTPLAMDNFAWQKKEAIQYLGVTLAAGGLLSAFCFGAIGPLSKRINERLLLIFAGICPMIIGRLIMMPMGADTPYFIGNYSDCGVPDGPPPTPEPGETELAGCEHCWCLDTKRMTEVQFLVGFCVSTVGYPFCIAIIGALYSKVLGPKPQGLYMGVLTMSGSLARVLGPIVFTRLYQEYGTYITFGTIISTLALSLVLFLLTYSRFVPPGNRPRSKSVVAANIIAASGAGSVPGNQAAGSALASMQ